VHYRFLSHPFQFILPLDQLYAVRCELLSCLQINRTLKADWSGVQLQVMSALIGVIYFGQELNQDGVMNINGALFIFLTNMTFQNVFAVISVST
jgi:hypothetical protein